MFYHPDDDTQLATMSNAHAEWHLNAGVPMGQPGCPQDACDPPPPDEEECEWCNLPEGISRGPVRFQEDILMRTHDMCAEAAIADMSGGEEE